MPVALGFVAAGLSGALAGFGAAGGMAAALGTAVLGSVVGGVVGMGLYGLNMLLAGSGQSNTTSPSGVSFTDTGLRFDPTPNFTSSQQVIPLVFGKVAVSPQIAHKRVYYTNYQRGFYFLACGEAPMDMESILVDDVDITEIANYTATPGDFSKSWYQWMPLGSTYTMTLNNTGEFNWGATDNKYSDSDRTSLMPGVIPYEGVFQTISGPIISLYGGGSVRCYFKFVQDRCDGQGWVRFKLENYYSPSDIEESTTSGNWHVTAINGQYSTYWYESEGWFYFWLDSTVAVGGGHIDGTTEIRGYYEFTGLEANTTWRVNMEYVPRLPASMVDKVMFTFDKVEVTDADSVEDFQCWGTAYAVVHLAWHETLSQAPQFTVIAKGFGRETGQEQGNPALCAYFLLADREHPESEPFDIVVDRVDPLMIDWDSVQETMAFCNSLNDGAGYYFNRAYGAPMEREKALKEMMAAGRFFIYQLSNCRYFFKPDRDEPLTRVISESMEVVPGSINYVIRDVDFPSVMRCSYYDSGLNYTVQTLPIELPSERANLRPEALDLTGVTDQHQAYELGRYALLCRQLLQYSITLDVRYSTLLACYLGDLVEIDSTDPILSGRKWRIMAIPGEKPGYVYTLQLNEHNADVYASKVDSVEEGGYKVFSPWYHIPIESAGPSSWPGGNIGPSQVVNLDITAISYYAAPSTLSGITIEYEFLASNADRVQVDYSTDNGQTWNTAGYSTSNTYDFDVDLRWGVLRVRAAAEYQGVLGPWAVAQEYVEGLGGDDAGIGNAQIGWSPIGGDSL